MQNSFKAWTNTDPPLFTDLLVTDGYKRSVGFYDGTKWNVLDISGVIYNFQVIYWMLIPALPK